MLLSFSLLAQQPTFRPSDILNAASLFGSDQPAVSTGMVLAIKGQFLAGSTAVADTSGILPTSLAGTTVTFNGVSAPLVFVSPDQINLQVPTAVRGAATADIAVTTASGSSSPVTVRISQYAWGIFTQNTTGCGAGSVFNIHADGSMALNTTQNSYDPAHDAGLALFFTGLGNFADRQDGTPWTFNPADNIAAFGTTAIAPFFGTPGIQQNQTLKLSYAGPAPGLIGIDQVNFTPYSTDQLFESCHVPMYLANFNQSASQIVSVSVHSGGGACVEPPTQSLGLITWQKQTVYDISSTISSEGVDIQLLQGQRLFFPNPPSAGSASCCASTVLPPTNCQDATPTSLNAGPLSISGVTDDPILISAPDTTGSAGYHVSLPAGSLSGGSYRVTSGGGPDVGAFDTSVAIPAPVVFTQAPAAGSTLTLPYQLSWTGGDARSIISIQLRITNGDFTSTLGFTEKASAGSFTIPAAPLLGPGGPIIIPSGNTELIISQNSAAPGAGAFTATGLTEGAEHLWSYKWDFKNLQR
jgi:uncharacterized protein (TIGR03437 family)